MNGTIALDRAATLLDCLDHYAACQPEAPAYTFVGHKETDRQVLSYGELHQRATRYAAMLQEAGLAQRNVLLLFPTGLDFIIAFFACAYARAVAIPANLARNSHHYTRLGHIVDNADAVAVLTVADLQASIAEGLGQQRAALAFHCEPDEPLQVTPPLARPDPGQLAFIQYTSGSTGVPKGVMIRHAQLIANERAIQSVSGLCEGFVGAGWLPQFHDMGLIGALLQPIALGGHYVFMSPLHFLQRPLRWLTLLSQYRAVATAAPNFALALCVQAEMDDVSAAQLDLSALRILFCGAEPVSAAVLAGFEDRFARHGLRAGTVAPCYGLAEATLIVSGGQVEDAPRVLHVARKALESGQVRSADVDDPDPQALVSCGPVVCEHQIAIVDPDSLHVLGDGQSGEVWFAGPSVAAGYWANAEASAATFAATTACGRGPWMRTGDLGFTQAGSLYIAGRIKELIILRGRNIHPHDLEASLREALPVAGEAAIAVFAVETGGTPRVVAYIEFPRRDRQAAALDFAALSRHLRAAAMSVHEVRLEDIVYLYQGAIPRTSSGKVQRHVCARHYLDGSIEEHRLLIHSTRQSNPSRLEAIAP